MIGRVLFILMSIAIWTQANAQTTNVTVPPKQLTLTQPGDANYTITVADTNLVTTTLTTTRTWTLPAASSVAYGATKTIDDLGGQVATPGNNIIVAPNGTDTINGRAGYTLGCPFGAVTFMSNGSNGWQATSQACDIMNAAYGVSINQSGVHQGPLTLMKMFPLPGSVNGSGATPPGAGLASLYITRGASIGLCRLVVVAGNSSTVSQIGSDFGGGC